ncbi:MAG TPA: response regulator transcription factor [Rudaea sp.]|nr:response regulator transcription factor [Rudaea sp.]
MSVRVLLADDHGIVRDGLRALLEAQGDIAVVGSVDNGFEAVDSAQKLRPHVVVMDISMPDMNGIDACRRINELAPDVKVLILSMHGSTEHVYQALKAGARGYLLKESAATEVVGAVRALFAGRQYLDAKIRDTVEPDLRERNRQVSPVDSLSMRERQILQLLVQGRSNAQIAALLSLSIKTVETYRSRLMQKLGIRNLADLVRFGMEHGLA